MALWLGNSQRLHLLLELRPIHLAFQRSLGVAQLQQLIVQKRQIGLDHRMIHRVAALVTAFGVGVGWEEVRQIFLI
ncbi:hypothetical protein D3C81_1308590 [compost metagenome]